MRWYRRPDQKETQMTSTDYLNPRNFFAAFSVNDIKEAAAGVLNKKTLEDLLSKLEAIRAKRKKAEEDAARAERDADAVLAGLPIKDLPAPDVDAEKFVKDKIPMPPFSDMEYIVREWILSMGWQPGQGLNGKTLANEILAADPDDFPRIGSEDEFTVDVIHAVLLKFATPIDTTDAVILTGRAWDQEVVQQAQDFLASRQAPLSAEEKGQMEVAKMAIEAAEHQRRADEAQKAVEARAAMLAQMRTTED
jgi:hypothetical protein